MLPPFFKFCSALAHSWAPCILWKLTQLHLVVFCPILFPLIGSGITDAPWYMLYLISEGIIFAVVYVNTVLEGLFTLILVSSWKHLLVGTCALRVLTLSLAMKWPNCSTRQGQWKVKLGIVLLGTQTNTFFHLLIHMFLNVNLLTLKCSFFVTDCAWKATLLLVVTWMGLSTLF